jgi:hypothetical protein
LKRRNKKDDNDNSLEIQLHAFLQYNNKTNVFSEANSSVGFGGAEKGEDEILDLDKRLQQLLV